MISHTRGMNPRVAPQGENRDSPFEKPYHEEIPRGKPWGIWSN